MIFTQELKLCVNICILSMNMEGETTRINCFFKGVFNCGVFTKSGKMSLEAQTFESMTPSSAGMLDKLSI